MNEIPLAYRQVGGLNFMIDAQGELLWCTLHLDACLLLVEHFQSLSMPLWALSRAAFFTGIVVFLSYCKDTWCMRMTKRGLS